MSQRESTHLTSAPTNGGEQMYYLGWIALLAVGLGASFLAFFWALASGQLTDQQRARFLPLVGEEREILSGNRKSKAPYYLGFVGMMVLAAMGFCVWLTWDHLKW